MTSVPSGILSTIGVGAMLNFVLDNGEYIGTTLVDVQTPVLCMDPKGADFTVMAYEFNGSNQAKIRLCIAGNAWSTATLPAPIPGVQYPITLALGPGASDFILSDEGGGNISIQTTSSPPAPFVQGIRVSGRTYLAYGFPAAYLWTFNIEVVG